ncbi:hypothetical protein EVAR_68826_1 [Eumeta japonica]|uniref:Uncharacterized protein n=1 Tax=Eumeta variegata TaxID=151549 RepID=A0A4C1ZYV4_EUMVA|nr:hypothetical protein EVAR_68826_1 [Eumeta japonica]
MGSTILQDYVSPSVEQYVCGAEGPNMCRGPPEEGRQLSASDGTCVCTDFSREVPFISVKVACTWSDLVTVKRLLRILLASAADREIGVHGFSVDVSSSVPRDVCDDIMEDCMPRGSHRVGDWSSAGFNPHSVREESLSSTPFNLK